MDAKIMAKILLAEDEQNIASFIRRGLQEFGHEVQVVHDGGTAWSMLQEGVFDLLVLDVIMPKMDGLEVCRQFRLKEGYHTPVIILTALEARIKALLRRGKERPDRQLWCHDLVLDCDTRRARRGDTVIELTVKEYRLLEYFMTHQGVALSRLVLLKDVWDKNFDTNTNVVDVYVNYLRNKIDRDFEVKLIRTIVGMGYIMGVR